MSGLDNHISKIKFFNRTTTKDNIITNYSTSSFLSFFFLVASFWLNFSLFGHLFIISLCFLDLGWRHIAGHKINMHVHFKVNFDNHIPFHLFRFLKNAVASCIVPPGLEFDKCVLMVGKHTANK